MKRLLILLMLVSQPAWAGWERLGETDSFTYYVDPTTLRKTPNGRRVWTMQSFGSPQRDEGGIYQSGKLLVEFDCAGERTRRLEVIFYSGPMGEGLVGIQSSSASQWRFASPGSVGDIELKAVCRMPLK